MLNHTSSDLYQIWMISGSFKVAPRQCAAQNPGATISEPPFERSIGFSEAWFNWYRRQCAAEAAPIPTQPADIPKATTKAAKAHVAQLVQTQLQNLPVRIRRTSYVDKKGRTIVRLGAFNDTGKVLRLITPDGAGQIAVGDRIALNFALASDGNARALWQHE